MGTAQRTLNRWFAIPRVSPARQFANDLMFAAQVYAPSIIVLGLLPSAAGEQPEVFGTWIVPRGGEPRVVEIGVGGEEDIATEAERFRDMIGNLVTERYCPWFLELKVGLAIVGGWIIEAGHATVRYTQFKWYATGQEIERLGEMTPAGRAALHRVAEDPEERAYYGDAAAAWLEGYRKGGEVPCENPTLKNASLKIGRVLDVLAGREPL